MRLGVMIALAATLSLIGFVIALILLGPWIGQQFQAKLGPSCAVFYRDDNGNARMDAGESQAPPYGAEIVISRADDGTVLLRYPADRCLLPQSAHNTTIKVTLILPDGHKTTTPERTVVVLDYIEDYPTQHFDISLTR